MTDGVGLARRSLGEGGGAGCGMRVRDAGCGMRACLAVLSAVAMAKVEALAKAGVRLAIAARCALSALVFALVTAFAFGQPPTPQLTRAVNDFADIIVVVENYPQLKSDVNFQRLMDELSGTENRIAVARGRYNERIQEYNTTRRRFPSNMTAKIFGFDEYPYFEAPKEAQQAPKVNFGNR